MIKKDKTKGKTTRVYEKPEITKVDKMTFMFEPYKKNISKVACRQCSSCHGCR